MKPSVEKIEGWLEVLEPLEIELQEFLDTYEIANVRIVLQESIRALQVQAALALYETHRRRKADKRK